MALQDELHVVPAGSGVQMGPITSAQQVGWWQTCAKRRRWCLQGALCGAMFNLVVFVVMLCGDPSAGITHQWATVARSEGCVWKPLM